MDLFVVIGNPKTRKSSLVRCLTGCFNRSRRDIALLSGKSVLQLYARVGCLQDTRTTPEAFVAEVERTRCNAVLCSLTASVHKQDANQHPDAQAYLDFFQARGWVLRSVAVLGQNAAGVRSPNLLQFPQAPTAPINVTAHAVRAHFGWL